MKRERELAERRKNEPKMDTNQDHLVRKIFSRFRKGGSTSSGNLLSGVTIPGTNASNGPCGSQSGTPSHSGRDIERGELAHQLSGEDSTGGGGGGSSPRREKMSLVKASKEDETGSTGSRSGSAKSKWGRMMRGGSGSSDAADPTTTSANESQSILQSLLPIVPKSASSPSVKSSDTGGGRAQSAGSGNKVHPKLSRVPERQESVDEPHPPMDRSRLKVGLSSSVSGDYSPPAAATGVGASGHLQHLIRSDSTSIIDSFSELKQEVRSEVQRINHKMSRLEDILGEILVRLTPSSVAAATSSTVVVRPPPLPSPRSPGGRSRTDSSASNKPFLIVPANVDSAGSGTPVAIDVDGGSSGLESVGTRSTGRGTSRTRPRSGDKLTTQFQEYV